MSTSPSKASDSLTNSEESGLSYWLNSEEAEEEGQLAIDVYENDKQIIVVSTIAGAKPENIKISLHNDLLIIKGRRENKAKDKDIDYLFQECYWGPFSRSIILPAQVDAKKVEAEIENGVLTITLLKEKTEKIKVVLKD